ncbi:BnaCnng55320D [Brassica napus]|uniref:BnaCnng55320D protein n=1 Tax=Brassica napus TaxID=3708 RepID=A0A078JQ21_BRANA|nr:BnaCnng55320D [Brassica napus]
MSTSRFAFFCIILVFLGSFHESAKFKVDAARAPYCYRGPKSDWCCITKPMDSCRGTRKECDANCNPKRRL